MTEKPTKTGKELERRVANAYRQMGARKVEHDVELAGNQIDVYVELETPGRLLHHIAVEVKDWSKSVGIDIVNQFTTIAGLLRREGLIDEGVIVSAKGFSKQARNAARIYNIRLLEPPDLEAMVAEVRQARMPCTAEGRSQDVVLDALYEHFKSCPASPQMMFGDLYKAIGISPNDAKKVGEIRHQLFSLKKKGLAEYLSLQGVIGHFL